MNLRGGGGGGGGEVPPLKPPKKNPKTCMILDSYNHFLGYN